MDMRSILSLLENTLAEARLVGIGGDPVPALRNPSRPAFEAFVERHGNLRGLLSADGTVVYLWPATMAVHATIMDQVEDRSWDCIFFNWGKWSGPNILGPDDRFVPALQRLTPRVLRWTDEDENLLRQLSEPVAKKGDE